MWLPLVLIFMGKEQRASIAPGGRRESLPFFRSLVSALMHAIASVVYSLKGGECL